MPDLMRHGRDRSVNCQWQTLTPVPTWVPEKSNRQFLIGVFMPFAGTDFLQVLARCATIFADLIRCRQRPDIQFSYATLVIASQLMEGSSRLRANRQGVSKPDVWR